MITACCPPRRRGALRRCCLVIAAALPAAMCVSQQTASMEPSLRPEPIAIDAVPVPLNPQDAGMTHIGEFRYAGGVALTSTASEFMHELSDVIVTSDDRFLAVGDAGILLDGRVVLDGNGRLVGVTNTTLMHLIDEAGRRLTIGHADAEGLALLANGDRLVSFERPAHILRYPKNGGRPHEVPSPQVQFPPNAGMEALTAEGGEGDGYFVGGEDSGATWLCHAASSCVSGPSIDKPKEFGLVSMCRVPGGLMAYLLRAYDPVQQSRIVLEIMRDTTVVARLELAPPLTVDNFEGVTAVARNGGAIRFYLISDDNHQASQRTLFVAFDWQPR